MVADEIEYDLDEYIEILKKLSDHAKREVCILISFMKYCEENQKGEKL